jgi:hypothetical protein
MARGPIVTGRSWLPSSSTAWDVPPMTANAPRSIDSHAVLDAARVVVTRSIRDSSACHAWSVSG